MKNSIARNIIKEIKKSKRAKAYERKLTQSSYSKKIVKFN